MPLTVRDKAPCAGCSRTPWRRRQGKRPHMEAVRRNIEKHHYRTRQGAAASHKREKVTGARSDDKERKTTAKAETR